MTREGEVNDLTSQPVVLVLLEPRPSTQTCALKRAPTTASSPPFSANL